MSRRARSAREARPESFPKEPGGGTHGAVSPPGSEPRESAQGSLAALAALISLIGTLLYSSDAPLWRADAALLSTLESSNPLGGFSASLSRLFLVLPLGSLTLRTTLLGAAASALSGACLCHITETQLSRTRGPSRMNSWLALAAALGVTFSLPFVTEATIPGGGAAPAAALAICLLAQTWQQRGLEPSLLSRVGTGLLFGLLLSESPWAALGVLLLITTRGAPPRRARTWLIVASSALGSSLFLLLPRALALSASEWADLRLLPSPSSFPAFALLDYLGQVGFVAALGILAVLVLAPRSHYLLGPLAVVLLDWMIPAAPGGAWLRSFEPSPSRVGLHLLALSSLAPLAALGLRTLADVARSLQLVAAEKSSALLTLLALGAAIAGIEDASRLLSQTEVEGPRAWTDAALSGLPRGALVLTHTRPVTSRLLAAKHQGERPDVLIVPLDTLAQAGRLEETLTAEPALKQLIVDLSVGTSPSERALSLLCDVRPVFVEADASWDRRLLEHLHPTLPLAEFSVHAIGHTERIASVERSAPELARIGAATELGLHPDLATREIVRRQLLQVQSVLEKIGDSRTRRALNDVVPPLLARRESPPPGGSRDVPGPALASQ